MCVAVLPYVLTAMSGAMSYMGQRQEGKAQAAMYNAQARAAEQNARIQARQNEGVADQYAQEQRRLDAQHRLARGHIAAEAGASGISGLSGTPLDLLSAERGAYATDSLSLLSNQRNDVYSGQLAEHNFLESAGESRAAAHNARKQAQLAGMGTILGTASSLWGINRAQKQEKKLATLWKQGKNG